MTSVGTVRFGAWVLNKVQKEEAKAGQPGAITLVLRPESEADLKYCNLDGFQRGTRLVSQTTRDWTSSHYGLAPVVLKLQTNDKGDLSLQSQYTVTEDRQKQEPIYETIHVEAGRGMSDDWEAAHDYESFTGRYETVTYEQNVTQNANLNANKLGVFRDLYDLLDSAKVDVGILKEAAIKPFKETPKLSAAFAQLGAGTDLLKQLLLEKLGEQPALKAALEEDAPILKESALQPVFTLLSAQGKKQAVSFQQQAAEEAAAQDQQIVAAQQAADKAKAALGVLTQRITG